MTINGANVCIMKSCLYQQAKRETRDSPSPLLILHCAASDITGKQLRAKDYPLAPDLALCLLRTHSSDIMPSDTLGKLRTYILFSLFLFHSLEKVLGNRDF